MKQTSIEWLREELWQQFKWQFSDNIFEQAKEMHKQEIIDAYVNGQSLGFDDSPKYWAEKYHQETFVSKGSDFKQFSLYEHKDTITSADTPVSKTFLETEQKLPQQEISDEEIEKTSIKINGHISSYVYDNEYENIISSFINGAKWYREQLKEKNNDNKL